mmetsp:Transcript_20420/g.56595  ORF Transcript_20420/g.56595 Transcript_20420/m.56595 type:complete len:406 (+) Transcript_20420:968-2185(+)
MCGAILAQANRVVGHHIQNADLREGSHTNGGTHVVREDEKGGAVGDEAAPVQGNAVDNGTHAVLTDSEAHVALCVGVLLEVTKHLHEGHVGGGQISGSSNQARDSRGNGVEHGLRVQTSGQALVLGGEGGQARLPALGQGTADQLLELCGLLGVLGGVGVHLGVPLSLDLGTLLNLGIAHGLVDDVGHLEGGVLPLQVVAGGGCLISAQGGTMDVVAVSLVGGAIADQGGDLDKRGLVSDCLGIGDGLADAINVKVAVLDVLYVPAQGLVAGAHILSEGDISVSVNRYLVVIIHGNQLAEAPVAGQGGSLVGNTLHVAAVTHDAVGVVVDNGITISLVVLGGKVSLSGSQADSIADTLAKRTGGNLDSLGHEVLGVTRGFGSPLAEALEVLNGQAVIATKVKQRV